MAKLEDIKARWPWRDADVRPWRHEALAHAPADVAWLLGEVERLTKELAEVKAYEARCQHALYALESAAARGEP